MKHTSEKNKMLRGELYYANDAELAEERIRAQGLCFDFNNTHPSNTEGQQRIMKQLLGATGESFAIMAPFHCDYGYNIKIGENFFANYNTVMLDCAPITFGNNVFVAPNCGFYTAGHPIDVKRRNAELEYALPISVDDNVWIGAGAHILPGVTIGNNTVIGAGSVVVKDIPDNVVAAGNPCRVIRYITDNDEHACPRDNMRLANAD